MMERKVINIEGHKVFIKFKTYDSPDRTNETNNNDPNLLSSDSNVSMYRGFQRPFLATLKKPQNSDIRSPGSNSQLKQKKATTKPQMIKVNKIASKDPI